MIFDNVINVDVQLVSYVFTYLSVEIYSKLFNWVIFMLIIGCFIFLYHIAGYLRGVQLSRISNLTWAGYFHLCIIRDITAHEWHLRHLRTGAKWSKCTCKWS